MNKFRTWWMLLFLASLPVFAQYQTPTVDGTVSPGEYANSSGNWSMTWDATYLYVAKTNLTNANNGVAVYLDVDPQSTPTAGSNSNGNTIGTADFTFTPNRLAFRADARIFGIASSPDIKSRDGSGGWGSANTSSADIIEATDGTTREVRVRWAALPGLSGVPSSFRWFGIEVMTGGTATDPMPGANGSVPLSTTVPYAYSITSTVNGAATNPFSNQEHTEYCATATATVLNSNITAANADTTSSRRFIVFNGIPANTITTSSDLTEITQTTTIDGTTAPGFTSTPVLVIAGFSTNINNDRGIRLNGCTGCVIRGLVLQNHGIGITVIGGSNVSIVGNYVGTTTAGTGTASNNVGIRLTSCSSCTIGGTTELDRNLVSGNSSGGISAVTTTSLTVQGNYIGVKANGNEALTNPVGVSLISTQGTLVGGTAAGAGNVINSAIDACVFAESSDDTTIHGNLMGVGADGTTALGGGNGVFAIGGSRLTVGGISASQRNTISNLGAAVLTDVSGGLSIRGNSMVSNDFAIDLAGSVVQPAPTVSGAHVVSGKLQVIFSLSSNNTSATTQSMLLDLYDADATIGAADEGSLYRATSPCYSGSSLTDQIWSVGSGYSVGDKVVLIATSYSDANCTTPGDGSSTFTSKITTTTGKTFTGPGSFSDTTKWSGGALPAAGQDFTILNACTFDSGAPARAYGHMSVGDGTTSGNLSWAVANPVVLDVEDIVIGAGNSGTAIDMTNSSSMRVRGNMTVGTNDFIGGAGTVEFTGTGKTVTSSAAIFHNVTITGTLAIGNTFYVNGSLDVQTGATFSGSAGTFLRPQNGATISGSGTKSFGTVDVASGVVFVASGNFSVSTAFTVAGSFRPGSSVVVTGTGLTLAPTGTIRVTRTGSNALTTQYVFSTIDTTNCTTEYTGSANQLIAARTFMNLKVDNPVSVQLTGNITVSNVLTLTQGLVMGAGNEIFVTNSAANAVVQGSGWTRLIIHRAIATGTNTYLYPLGTGSVSQPVTVTFNNVTVAGVVNMQGVTNSPNGVGGGSGLDPSKDVSNVWRFTVESAVFDSCDITINFGTSYDAGADPTRFVLRRTSGVDQPWFDMAATPGATSIATTGQALTGQNFLATGNQLIDHYTVSASSPQTAGIAFNTTVTAYDVLNVTANVDGTVVTMTSSTGNAQYDSDGNGTFGDNTKTLSNGTFTISTKDNAAESVTLTATDTNSKTGTSGAITVSAQVFTGPGSFSDTTKWSGNALPNAGAAFVILGTCTFDNASPVRTYGAMTLGDGTTTGALQWQAGNAVVLDVGDVTLQHGSGFTPSLLDMTNGGTLRVSGNFDIPLAGDVTGGTGTVELTGTGKTVYAPGETFHNVTVTGSITLSGNTFFFDGVLDVQGGATLATSGALSLRPQNGASLTGSGTKSFNRIDVDPGFSFSASGNFSVTSVFSVNGTFTPTAATVVSGAGTIGGIGTMQVTRTGSAAMSNQYTLTIDLTTNTVEYAGSGASQTISAPKTYFNLKINNSSGVTLSGGDVTVTGVLNLAAGLAQGTGNDFIVTNSSPSAVIQGAGWTRLTFRRTIATGTNTYLYPIGPAAGLQSVNVTFNNVTVSGVVRMIALNLNVNQVDGNSGLDITKDVGNTWQMENNSATFSSYDVTINFGTMYDAGADPLKFVLRRYLYSTEQWSPVPAAVPGATSITVTGETVSEVHVYAAAEQEIHHYVVSASSPQSAGTPFTATVTAQDVLNVNATNVSGRVVTMTSSTGNAQFDSDGNGTFGDNTKSLTNGAFTISTKDNTIESVTITGTDTNSKSGTSGAISVNLGPASVATTTISASLSSINAGGSTSTITVQARDAGGNSLTSSGGTVTLSTNLGTIGSVTDNNNGTYTATLTSGQAAGTATISGTVNGSPITHTEAVTFTTPPFGAPPLFLAAATSTTQVSLSWTAVSGATSYEVWRSSLNSAYILVGTPIGATMNNTGLTAGRTYVYKVRAVNGGGASSFSTPDAATTIVFTDATLIAGTTQSKAVHVTELRTAVNLMREAAGLSAATFTDSILIAGTTKLKAVHLTELRTALDQARALLGVGAISYTDPTLTAGTTAVKGAHITELRAGTQ